jgi:hypothetical protein
MSKIPRENLNNQHTVKKNEGQEGKTDPVQGLVPVGGGRVNGEGEEG